MSPERATAPIVRATEAAEESAGRLIEAQNTPTPATPETNWGDVFDCAIACSGRRDCSWCPYRCGLIVGRES